MGLPFLVSFVFFRGFISVSIRVGMGKQKEKFLIVPPVADFTFSEYILFLVRGAHDER